MSIYHLILIVGFGICLISCLFQFSRIILSYKKNPAQMRGNMSSGIMYSFVGGMSPFKKESAFLHFPTYIAGIIYHIGTVIAFLWLILHFVNIYNLLWLRNASFLFLNISSICGIAIFIKRIIKPEMRNLSYPDDYISNLIVTGFQILTAMVLIIQALIPFLFIYSAVLFIYIPISKLQHVIYFFTSRIYLGIFYGSRGTWPVKK